jgi:nucleoside transporter
VPTPFLLAAADAAASLELGMRLPLSALNFLEFAIWGAWYVVLGNYLNSLQFSRKDIGRIYATIPIGSVIAPLFVGAIADMYFASEQLLGVLHLAGAVLLFAMAQIKQPRAFFWTALAYALAYSPTLALANAVVFANVPASENDFPMIRVLGTVGWILAGLSLRLFIKPGQPVNNRPLLLAAALSLILGVYSFFLPHTPPKGKSEVFLTALDLFKDSSFAVFFGVSFLITIALAFYYSFTPLYLESGTKVKPANVGPVMTIGQWVEIGFMLSLPWFLAQLGMKWVLLLGMAAWAVRYALFTVGRPFALVLLGIALHGICFDFFFAAGFIYVDKTAPEAIRASAQSLFAVLTYGLGMWLGTEASGYLNQWLTTEAIDPNTGEKTRVTNWNQFWLYPCLGALLSLLLFAVLFRAA